MRQTQPYDPLVDAIESIMAAKKKRQFEQQFGQVSPILAREGDRATNIRDALAAIQAEQGPTGVGGALDRLNPFAPARGRGSEIEQSLLAEQMKQPKQPSMKVVVGNGKTWLVNPQTGEKRDLGIVPPKSKVGDRNISDIINDIAKMSQQEDKGFLTRLGPELIDTQKSTLRDELMRKMGVEDVEIPGEKRSRLGLDWLAKDVPARTEVRKKGGTSINPITGQPRRVFSREGEVIGRRGGSPITQTLTETGRRKAMPSDLLHRGPIQRAEILTPPGSREKIKPTPLTGRKRVKSREIKAKERPPKPKEYPDAVWNEEHQMWTIVKNGRLMGVK